MKQIFAFLFMFFVAGSSLYAQNKTIRYCEIVPRFSGLGDNKLHVKLSTGSIDSLFSFRDAGINDKLQKVNSLTTIPDVLNYMATQGWELVCVAAIPSSKYYYFKKEFEYQDIKH